MVFCHSHVADFHEMMTAKMTVCENFPCKMLVYCLLLEEERFQFHSKVWECFVLFNSNLVSVLFSLLCVMVLKFTKLDEFCD